MRRAVAYLLLLGALLGLGEMGLTRVKGYTTATVRSGTGSFLVASPPTTEDGDPRPLLYCTAPDILLYRPLLLTDSKPIPVTCYNGFNHSISLEIAYTLSTGQLIPPSFTPDSPLSLTVPGGGSAQSTITVTVTTLTSPGTVALTYTVTTPGSPAVEISTSFQSTVDVSLL